MQKNTRLDFKVGIFVIVAIVILVMLLLFIGDFRIFKPGYNLNLIFGFANGIKESAPVRLAGVEVGRVKQLRVFYEPKEQKTKVEIKIWIESEAKVNKDAIVAINTLGILGEKYVEILPGVDYSSFFKEGDTIIGKDPVSMDEITTLGKKIALKLEDSIDMINQVVSEDIMQGKGTLGKLISDKKIYQDLEELVADVKAHPWKLFYRPKD